MRPISECDEQLTVIVEQLLCCPEMAEGGFGLNAAAAALPEASAEVPHQILIPADAQLQSCACCLHLHVSRLSAHCVGLLCTLVAPQGPPGSGGGWLREVRACMGARVCVLRGGEYVCAIYACTRWQLSCTCASL